MFKELKMIKQKEKSDEGTDLRWFNDEYIKNHQDIFENTKEKTLKAIELINQ